RRLDDKLFFARCVADILLLRLQKSLSLNEPAPPPPPRVGHRFRGFLPVVVDVETGGFNSATDALLEVAAVILGVDERGDLVRRQTAFTHVEPFPGARLDPASMEVTGIKV